MHAHEIVSNDGRDGLHLAMVADKTRDRAVNIGLPCIWRNILKATWSYEVLYRPVRVILTDSNEIAIRTVLKYNGQ